MNLRRKLVADRVEALELANLTQNAGRVEAEIDCAAYGLAKFPE